MKINLRWPEKIDKYGCTNGMQPWYWVVWAAIWAVPAMLCLLGFIALVGIVNLDWESAKECFEDNA